MSERTQKSGAPRGFTMIESMITMVVLIIAFLGFATLQLVGVQANYFGDRLVQASQLATDLTENVRRWPYTDPRLTPLSTITGPSAISDPSITGNWDLGTSLATSSKVQYSDLANDPNATNPGALGTNYQGLSSDVNLDGVPDFILATGTYTPLICRTAERPMESSSKSLSAGSSLVSAIGKLPPLPSKAILRAYSDETLEFRIGRDTDRAPRGHVNRGLCARHRLNGDACPDPGDSHNGSYAGREYCEPRDDAAG